MHRAEGGTVEAAGGVVWRNGKSGPELVVIHRPRRSDWSLPKGHLEPGETHRGAARREVREETGLEVDLGDELPCVRYVDGRGRPKRVRYWLMTPGSGSSTFQPTDEVDEWRWCSLVAARDLLTYEADRELIDAVEMRAPWE